MNQAPHEVTVTTPESLALLDLHLANSGIPEMHRERFDVQARGRGLYLVAWRQGLPVGYVLIHFRHPPHHASYDRYSYCAYVEALDVGARHRRQGFAQALMSEAERRAQLSGASTIGLSVGVDNAPARALYRKLGYRPTSMPDYRVSWRYNDPMTGDAKEEGEICSFWTKTLTE